MQELHENGYSIRAIANEIGIDKTKVQRILKKLQEISVTDNSAELVTQIDKVYDTCDTFPGKLPYSSGDTGDTDEDIWSDTPFDIGERIEKDLHSANMTPISVAKTYTLAEIKNITAQAWLFMLEYSEYVNNMSSIHMGQSYVKVSDYRGYYKKAQRLIQSAKFISDQVEENHEYLLVTQVLQSIKLTIERVISGKDHVKTSCGQYYLDDKKVRALQFWDDALEADFFHPLI